MEGLCSPVGFGLPVMSFDDERGALKPAGDSTSPALPSLSVDSRGHIVCRTEEHVGDDTASQHRQKRGVDSSDNYKRIGLTDEQPALITSGSLHFLARRPRTDGLRLCDTCVVRPVPCPGIEHDKTTATGPTAAWMWLSPLLSLL